MADIFMYLFYVSFHVLSRVYILPGEVLMDIGLIVDLETTGLDSKNDEIIEIGIIQFGINAKHELHIIQMYSALQDPGVPLSEEITKITGLTNEAVSGKKIDWAYVRRLFDESSIAIAHNADFDSAFLRNSPEFNGTEIHWACSVKHIRWRDHGFKSRALNYLAADHGFVNPFAHRALFDCATTFRLVEPYIEELIVRSYEREFMIQAVNSPFEAKDQLKARGYHWDPSQKYWYLKLLECDLNDERNFLSSEIYRGDAQHREVALS